MIQKTVGILQVVVATVLIAATTVEAQAQAAPAAGRPRSGGLLELLCGPKNEIAENDAYRRAQQRPERGPEPFVDVTTRTRQTQATSSAKLPVSERKRRAEPQPSDAHSPRAAVRSTLAPTPPAPALFSDDDPTGPVDPVALRTVPRPRAATIRRTAFEQSMPWETEQLAQAESALEGELVPPPNAPPETPTGPAPFPSTNGAYSYESSQAQNYATANGRAGNQVQTLTALLGDDGEDYQRQMREQQFCEQMWQCAGGRCLSWRDRWLRDWRRTYEMVYQGPCGSCGPPTLVSLFCEPVLYPRQNLGWVVGMGPLQGNHCTSADSYWDGFCSAKANCGCRSCTTRGVPQIARPAASCTTSACTTGCSVGSYRAPTPAAYERSDLFQPPSLHP